MNLGILEAMAMGLATMMTAMGGRRELSKTGFRAFRNDA